MSEIIFDNPWPATEHDAINDSKPRSPTSTLGRNPWRSSIRGTAGRPDSEDSFEDEGGEFSELTGDDIWRNKFLARPPTYPERSTIGKFTRVASLDHPTGCLLI
jgi:hypothetical protein